MGSDDNGVLWLTKLRFILFSILWWWRKLDYLEKLPNFGQQTDKLWCNMMCLSSVDSENFGMTIFTFVWLKLYQWGSPSYYMIPSEKSHNFFHKNDLIPGIIDVNVFQSIPQKVTEPWIKMQVRAWDIILDLPHYKWMFYLCATQNHYILSLLFFIWANFPRAFIASSPLPRATLPPYCNMNEKNAVLDWEVSYQDRYKSLPTDNLIFVNKAWWGNCLI